MPEVIKPLNDHKAFGGFGPTPGQLSSAMSSMSAMSAVNHYMHHGAGMNNMNMNMNMEIIIRIFLKDLFKNNFYLNKSVFKNQ